MDVSLCLGVNDQKKHWWVRNRKLVEKYVKDARNLIATQERDEIVSALNLLDAALALSPRLESALELKAKSLLYLWRFKDVADMLQDYIPSLKMSTDDSGSVSSDNSSTPFSRERVKLLPSNNSSSDSPVCDPSSIKCFSVSDLKKKVMAGLSKNCDKEGQWSKELKRSWPFPHVWVLMIRRNTGGFAIERKVFKGCEEPIATQEQDEIVSTLNLLDAALALSPHLETALELKAMSFLYLKRLFESFSFVFANLKLFFG